MNTVLMYVIMCLVCWFKALGGGFRNLKFDLHVLYKYNYILTRHATSRTSNVQIVGNSKIYLTILINFYHHIVALRCVAARTCAKQAAWDLRVQICIENYIPEMPLSRQLVQIIGRNKFSIRFKSLCRILRVSSQTRMSQNQAKSNYKDCSFGNQDSFVKGTRLSELILAKS